jgi:hypothetical protein
MNSFVRLATILLAVSTLAACTAGNVVSRGTEDGSWQNTRTGEWPTTKAEVNDAAAVMERAVTK